LQLQDIAKLAEPAPNAQMGTRDTYQKTLVQACIVAGDETALAAKLGVPVLTVVDWLLGDRELPTEMFLRAVDVVLLSNKQHIEDTRALIAQIRQRHRESRDKYLRKP
jgi:hypothetical protein